MSNSGPKRKGRVQPPFSLIKPPPIGDKARTSLPVGGYENEVLLGKAYAINHTPDESKIQLLASDLKLTPSLVRLWFERQRSRDPAWLSSRQADHQKIPGAIGNQRWKFQVDKLKVMKRTRRSETPPPDPRFSEEDCERARMAQRVQRYRSSDPARCPKEYDQEEYEAWLLAKVETALRQVVRLLGWTTFEDWTNWVMGELGVERYQRLQRWLIYWMEVLGFRCFLQALAVGHDHLFGISEEEISKEERDLALAEKREGQGLSVRLSLLQDHFDPLGLHETLNNVESVQIPVNDQRSDATAGFWVYKAYVVRKIVDLGKIESVDGCSLLEGRLRADLEKWKGAPYEPLTDKLFGDITPKVIHAFFRTPAATKPL